MLSDRPGGSCIDILMWNTLKDWHNNPMSAPSAIKDDSEGYFLEEDVDVAAWISKVSSDISHPTFMNQMKVLFGSRLNFETTFSGFPSNLLRPNHQASMWITNCSTPFQQRLDVDLDSYNQAHEPVLPYDEVPPSSTPDVEMEVPAVSD
ncbi:hypothetical protein M422DRAFT_264670 [Sphaerobolus stellatus SS14]|uniref:Uncharacterized protein n=1 Tax=Sphaerobolus stellatus (strain SS14) TaxID=990650 RepID=A0A0C9UFA5_SPHS4|nr:hypothetical protein M422DRAFT_264670 [Sphaerobolus stellatus SS14]